MPILNSQSLEIISRSANQTRRVGIRLGSLIKPGDIINLEGELGAGKTTLVQGIAAGWGSYDSATSPSFVLVNVYRRSDNERLYHLDAYRLDSVSEAIQLDIDQMLDSGPLMVEWADRIREILPKDGLWITLHWIEEEQRDLLFTPHGTRYKDLLADMRRLIFGVQG